MTPAELIQTALGVLAVGGIGGIWFRLGTLTAAQRGTDRRCDGLQSRIERLEGTFL
jgi:hypothetical protein